MIDFVVETGVGLPDATSYASMEEANDYFGVHPFHSDNWLDLGEPDKERLLMAASAQLDALITWRGWVASASQALGWPRVRVVDDEGRMINSDIVPRRVRQAMFELAFFLSRGDPYAASSSAGLERLKIDVIELQFSESMSITPVPAAALTLLRGLGAYAFGTRLRRVLVG